ncbi:DUF2975 domain-containing protein [Radiobacillus deserti]|uniref:DUF2975 domain-containing protein n=1 Tax=Radiobacillus deserti TaxID=2594883 RepID=A0A516KDJ8_9BACI|nr:DUF2975 domain-containing protein [Radiobacillus deserti]QDP39386.1 DUF2975 domain-containing protein [Radiobacillus deserti]
MKQTKTLILKIVIFIMAIFALGFAFILLPDLAKTAAGQNPEYAYLKNPVLIGLWTSLIPFNLALFHAYKLLKYINQNHAFSHSSVSSLRFIRNCAVAIIGIFVIGMIFLMTQHALHPGIGLIGLAISGSSLVIALFAGVLKELLLNALEIKAENDLTV